MNHNLEKIRKFLLYFPMALILACSSVDGVEEIRQVHLLEHIEQAGWNGAKLGGGNQTIYSWLLAMARASGTPGEIHWTSVSKGSISEIRASFTEGPSQPIRFLFDPESRIVYSLTENVSNIFMYLGEIPPPVTLVQPIPRFEFIDRLSGGQAAYRFEGCIMNRTPEAMAVPQVRATLLTEEADGSRMAFRGTPRYPTDRSGIPALLGSGQTFCTTLTSGKHPGFTDKKPPKALYGQIEMLWKDTDEILRHAHLSTTRLDSQTYYGKPLSGLAVISGGSYSLVNEKNEKQFLPGPMLVHLKYQMGKKFQMESEDGKQLLVSTHQVIGLYPDAPVLVRDDVLKLVRRMISAASSGTLDTLKIKQLCAGPDTTLARLQQHFQEHFSFPEPFEPESIDILPLARISSASGFSVTFYATASKNGHPTRKIFETLWLRNTEDGPRLVFP